MITERHEFHTSKIELKTQDEPAQCNESQDWQPGLKH